MFQNNNNRTEGRTWKDFWDKPTWKFVDTLHALIINYFLYAFRWNIEISQKKINNENNSENTIFIFTVRKNGLFVNLRLKVLPKRFKM